MKKTNLVLRELIETLYKYAKKYNANIWACIAEELERPSRKRRVVNVSKINRYTKPNECVVVPGKVLGAGRLEHPVTVAAFGFSKTAVEKITMAGGRAISIFKLLEERPTGSNVKIIG
ncbi:MAG: 50S ribosomal protein L18e [Desulfurococcaceae archaeon]|nr:50S ribosomal protein L18e [Desulfurococcaceae archaeon]